MQYQTSDPAQNRFMYFAAGPTHAPHHVPKEWIAKVKGNSTQGGTR